MNKKIISLPMYDPQKIDLPKRSDYVGCISWLKAVKESVGEPIIFALDQALMCQGNFCGRNEEFIIWVYGDESLSRFNGVVILGNQISQSCIEELNGLQYTIFEKTIIDSIMYEYVLDLQGITEALNKYYYSNGESLRGITIPSRYCEQFETLLKAALDYYDYSTPKPNKNHKTHFSR